MVFAPSQAEPFDASFDRSERQGMSLRGDPLKPARACSEGRRCERAWSSRQATPVPLDVALSEARAEAGLRGGPCGSSCAACENSTCGSMKLGAEPGDACRRHAIGSERERADSRRGPGISVALRRVARAIARRCARQMSELASAWCAAEPKLRSVQLDATLASIVRRARKPEHCAASNWASDFRFLECATRESLKIAQRPCWKRSSPPRSVASANCLSLSTVQAKAAASEPADGNSERAGPRRGPHDGVPGETVEIDATPLPIASRRAHRDADHK